MNEWYRKLLLLLMMASDPKPSEEKKIQKLADELLNDWMKVPPND